MQRLMMVSPSGRIAIPVVETGILLDENVKFCWW